MVKIIGEHQHLFSHKLGKIIATFSSPLNLIGNTLSIAQSGVATSGYLSTTDRNTFNNKVSFPGFGTDHITAAYGDHNHTGVYEPVLGNPGVDGYVLSSTIAGVRSWIAAGGASYRTQAGGVLSPTTTTDSVNIASGEAYMQNNINLIRVPAGSATSICIGDSGGAISGGLSFIGGYLAGASLTSGEGRNVILGSYAGNVMTTQIRCTIIGTTAGRYNTGSYNVYIGYSTGTNATSGQFNTALGYSAMGGGVVTGSQNFALGGYAGLNLTSGSDNLFLGYESGKLVTTGLGNSFIGSFSGKTNTASNNTGFGTRALEFNSSGVFNTALGSYSLRYTVTGNSNTAIGYQTGQGVSGNSFAYNTLVGAFSGYSLSIGGQNTLSGYYSGYSLTSGENNTFYGFMAGQISTGSSNVFLGAYSGYTQTTNSNLLIIDNQNRTSAALEATNSLIYGGFSATVANQTLRFNARVGINITPSAYLTLPAGTATAGTAPIKLTTGTALGTPEDGALEYHTSHLYFTIGATRYQLDQQGGGSGAFSTTSNVTSNAPGTYLSDDFVFGGPKLTNDGDDTYASRFLFDKSLSAFRAGYASGVNRDLANIGSYSTAFGYSCMASGGYSFAAGIYCQATNTGAVAVGSSNVSSGLHSFACGSSNNASGHQTVSAGAYVDANGLRAFAFGYKYKNTFQYSLSIGYGTGITDTTGVSIRLDADADQDGSAKPAIYIKQGTAPSTTTDKLYNVGGSLYWNGTLIA